MNPQDASKTENNPGFYRRNFDKISGNLDTNFDNPEFVKKHAMSFFGLSKKDLSLMTDEEVDTFKRVTKFLAKRVINAQAQKANKDDVRLERLLEEDIDEYNRLLFHDISHSIGWFVFNNQDNVGEKKYVPLFFQTPPEAEMNNAKILEQEMFATIWQAIRPGTLPLSLAILRKGGMNELVESAKEGFPKKDADRMVDLIKRSLPESSQEYVHDYLYFLYSALGLAENKFAIHVTADRLFAADQQVSRDAFITRNHDQYDAIVRNMIEAPNPQLVEMLTFIYDNKDNPRVLVDLFLKYCEPLSRRAEAAK